MVSQHANSPCCGAKIRRYGGKRRQCLNCKKTWSIRPLRRGRRRKRLPNETLLKVIKQGYPLQHFARRRPHLKHITFRHHFRNLLRSFVARPRKIVLPPGPLVILLDGLWFQFGGSPWVLYQMALKPCVGATAIFLDPHYCRVGKHASIGKQRSQRSLRICSKGLSELASTTCMGCAFWLAATTGSCSYVSSTSR